MAEATSFGSSPALNTSDFDQQMKNVKMQFLEQNKLLEKRTKKKIELLRDLNDFFTAQAEIEKQYAVSLEGLFTKYSKPRAQRGFMAAGLGAAKALRRSETEVDTAIDSSVFENHRPTGLAVDVWQVLLGQTKKRADSRLRFATNLHEEMRNILSTLEVESAGTSKKCLEMTTVLQNELSRSIREVDENMRVYQKSQDKLVKASESLDTAKSKGQLKKGEKLREKSGLASKKALQSRNEYLLSLVGANAGKDRYYAREVSNIVDSMDSHYHESFRYVFQLYHDLSRKTDAVTTKALASVHDAADMVSASKEKRRFLRDNLAIFTDPTPFTFLQHRDDTSSEILASGEFTQELLNRYMEIENVLQRLDRQIKGERDTINTILNLRGAVGSAARQTTEDGMAKSIENAVMHAEANQRLTTKLSQRHALACMWEAIGRALGDSRPELNEKSPPLELDEPEVEEIDVPTPESSLLPTPLSTPRVSIAISESAEDGLGEVSDATIEPESPRHSSDAGNTNRKNTAPTAASVHAPSRKAPQPPPGQKAPTSPTAARKAAAAPAPKPKTTVRTKPERPPEPAAKSPARVKPVPAVRRPSSSAEAASKPGRPPVPGVTPCRFGENLIAATQGSNLSVPRIVDSCIACLVKYGIRDEGLFRVPGSSSQIDELKRAFEAGQDVLADGLPAGIDTEAVAGTLKLYLRQLEDPVITRKMYASFAMIGGIDDHNNRLMAMREAVAEHLPKPHGAILEALMPFLHLVSRYSDENKMNVSNLALVFGPTLMPAPKDDFGAMLRDATAINTLMASFINYHSYVLPNAKPVAGQSESKAPSAAASPEPQPEPKAEAAPKLEPETKPVIMAEPEPEPDPEPEPEPESESARIPSQDPNAAAPAATATAATQPAPASAARTSPPVMEALVAVEKKKEKEEEEEEDVKYARAQFDYKARNDTEIPFKKGDILTVYDQADKNWWTGELNGKQGFIAAAYVKMVEASAAKEDAAQVPPSPAKPARSPRLQRKTTVHDSPPPASETVAQTPEPVAQTPEPAAAMSAISAVAHLDIANEPVARDASPSPMGAPPLPPSDHLPAFDPSDFAPPPAVDTAKELASLPLPAPTEPVSLRQTRGRQPDLSPKMTRTQSFGPTFAPPPPPPGSGGSGMLLPEPEDKEEEEEFAELELPPMDMDASLFLPPPPTSNWSDDGPAGEDMPPPPMSDEEC